MSLSAIRSAGMTTLRRIRAARGGAAVIVTYHRVHDFEIDPENIAVTTRHFEEHVSAFARRYTLMTVGEVLDHLRDRRPLPRNAVVITLDDGYVDCHAAVLPILRAHEARATSFVVADFVDSDRELWWDAIERVCLRPGTLPRTIGLRVHGAPFEFSLSPEACDLSAGTSRALADWDVTQPPRHERHNLYLELRKMLHPLDAPTRIAVLDELAEQTGTPTRARAAHRGVTTSELRELDSSGHFEIGAHTVSHQSLAHHSAAEQRAEIEGGKARLEELLGHAVSSFSYPYGSYDSFSAQTRLLVQQAGLGGACTTELGRRLPWGSVALTTDSFELPRTASWDTSAAQMTELIDKRLGL